MGYCFCVLEVRMGAVNMRNMRTLYIDDLCVDEKYRGRHIGERLYRHVYDYAKQSGCHNLTLHVWEGNDTARKFYDNLGMKVQFTSMETIL